MRIAKAVTTVVVLVVFAAININLALSQHDQGLEETDVDEELEQELKWLKAETYVITVSKVMEKIEKAPASITVINDRQIRQMGAKHLQDVINREIPSYSSVLGSALYVPRVRGYGSKVVKMINSR